MLRLLLRRLGALVPLLLVVSVLVFGLVVLLPGDPAEAIIGENATREQLQAIRTELGLDEPLVVQYGRWLGGVVQGDLGTSLFTSYPVAEAIWSRLPVTVSLVGLALLLSVAVGLPLGVLAGYRRGSRVDRVVTVVSSVGVAVPNFWLGLVLVLVFSFALGWLPSTGYVGISASASQWLRYLALPAATLAAAGAAEVARQTRASLADVMQQDFIRTVRAKGMRTAATVGKHGLKNALVPVVTVTGLQVSRLFGLSVIVEQIFDLPGVGTLAIESVFKPDVPMTQGIVLLVTAVVLATNLLVDVSYGYFNPKVRAA